MRVADVVLCVLDGCREVLLRDGFVLVQPVVAEAEEACGDPDGVGGGEAGGEGGGWGGRDGSVPGLPDGDGGEGEVLVDFAVAVRGAQDLVLVGAGGVAAGGGGVAVFVVGLVVEDAGGEEWLASWGRGWYTDCEAGVGAR